MDILAHTLWTNASARGVNRLREKKGEAKGFKCRVDGVSWSNKWYMIINYSALAVVWCGIVIKKLRRKK